MSASANPAKEIITAIDDELAAIAVDKQRKPLKLRNGVSNSTTDTTSTYTFSLPFKSDYLVAGPCKGRIKSQEVELEVVSLSQESITVALPKQFGSRIEQVELFGNREDLLVRLKERFESVQANPDKTFSLSNELIRGRSRPLTSAHDVFQHYPDLAAGLNLSQQKAVKHSYASSLSILWGPPGTGKTNTIAKIVQAHLTAGRRVLILSQANLAVDGALIRLAEQLQDSLYSQGQLIRLGTCQDTKLASNFPFVIKDNVVTMQQKPLLENLRLLTEQKRQLESVINETQAVLSKIKPTADLQIESAKYTKTAEQLRAGNRDLVRQIAAAKDATNIAKLTALQESIQEEHDQQMENVCRLADQLKDIAESTKSFLARYNLPNTAAIQKQSTLLQAQSSQLKAKIQAVRTEINEKEDSVVNEARVVATTITQTFMFTLYKQIFDVVIVDEVSMVSLCQLYWAASKASLAITLVGDFKQLRPIARGDTKMVKQWFKQSIFDQLGIDTAEGAVRNEIITLLDTQYRMAPGLSQIANNLFYNNQLKDDDSTRNLSLDDSLCGNEPVVIVDSSDLSPASHRPDGDGKRNFFHAQAAASLAIKLSSEFPLETIGIITPYRKQATLIKDLLSKSNGEHSIAVNTVHSFQGSEQSIVIFDTVESPGSGDFSMINEDKHADAEILLNVALTRARKKLYILANCDYLQNTFRDDSFVGRILKRFAMESTSIPARSLFRHASQISDDERACSDVLYDETSFFPQLQQDLDSANRHVIIASAFLTRPRTERLLPWFQELIARGVSITVFSRPPEARPDRSPYLNQEAYQMLTDCGVTVKLVKELHQKIVIIDGEIAWNGSLNILSYSKSYEIMHRIVDKPLIKELDGVIERLTQIADLKSAKAQQYS